MRRPNKAAMLLLVLFTTVVMSTIADSSSCNYMLLVKCLIDVLDDWAWALYKLRSNVVTIRAEQCAHLHQLDRCVHDTADEQHHCTQPQLLNASYTVSDLLTHRKNSGTFLKSFYLLQFACTERGQSILDTHRDCLDREHIGQMTLAASTYLDEKFFAAGSTEDPCTALNDKVVEYNKAIGTMCSGEAAELMCQSLLDMFKNVYMEKLAHCDFVSCIQVAVSAEALPTGDSAEGDDARPADYDHSNVHGSNAMQGVDGTTSGAGGQLCAALGAILVALIVR